MLSKSFCAGTIETLRVHKYDQGGYMVYYVDSQNSSSAEEIAFLLNKCILQYPCRWSELVFLCIGSDRVTGDCLGPYIGHQLLVHLNSDIDGVNDYGTL